MDSRLEDLESFSVAEVSKIYYAVTAAGGENLWLEILMA